MAMRTTGKVLPFAVLGLIALTLAIGPPPTASFGADDFRAAPVKAPGDVRDGQAPRTAKPAPVAFLRGVLRSCRDRAGEAAALCVETLGSPPERAARHVARAHYWSKKENFDRAIVEYTRAIACSPRYAS